MTTKDMIAGYAAYTDVAELSVVLNDDAPALGASSMVPTPTTMPPLPLPTTVPAPTTFTPPSIA